MKTIIIVGGGLSGMELAKELSRTRDLKVVLVDKNNYNFFPPLLYQVSTAFIEASNISYPFRRIFQERENISFYMGSLLRVEPETNTLVTDSGSLQYDYLVLAMGAETNFFGNQNIIRNALPMKSIDDALNLRNHILLKLEEASRSTSLLNKSKLVNLVIAGGGPTGVELAGMLAEMKNHIGTKDYPQFTTELGQIYLINSGPALLGPMSTKAQKEAQKIISKLGVTILLNTLVTDYVNEKVMLSTGESIATATLIWVSGVIGREVEGLPKEVIGRGRRIMVDEKNHVQGFENIFAIGDQCLQVSDAKFPNGHPQLAQVAMQQGKLLGQNLIRLQQGRPAKPFRYFDKGSMAIISKYKAVVDLPRGFFSGFIAWLVWLFIHIIPLISFRNKSRLAFTWFWSFVTNNPTLRLIIRPEKKYEVEGNQGPNDEYDIHFSMGKL
ncbi:NAD(P)/FAD-dependent oxidoreductase [Dyadobacter sp. CY261]|uniref:NAD(P)/FAD-dependent oxidoreductase n=1 Tax=Dyadobacter sp. CY261 TaxID=2907203 RepID=UPI001F484D05|nr:NAD(P)/FAD-dependent oxidoreductase [Dyadobacter sp. CY261]MCF0069647.1 NAD(P)/FAD-dependent oxidoreductase [Dyadobacter sp. CY261]